MHDWFGSPSNKHLSSFKLRSCEDIRVVVPSVQELSGCKSAQDVENIPALDQNGEQGFEGSAIFIPGPVLRNAIIESNSRNPSELIPIIYQTARTFDQERNINSAIPHADDLCAWIWSVKEGLVPETRYSVNPDDEEVEAFYFKRQKDCISSLVESTGPRAGETLALEGNMVISQLTNALTIFGGRKCDKSEKPNHGRRT